MRPSKPQIACTPWFREEDWPRWRAMDSQLQPEYVLWREYAEEVLVAFKTAGLQVAKVPIYPDEFLAWSTARGLGVDKWARLNFASFKTAMRGDFAKND